MTPRISPHWYKTLPGFFDYEDLYLEECARVPEGGSITEVGVWCGRSLVFMAVELANRGKNVTLNGVDLWEATPEMPAAASQEALLMQLTQHGTWAHLHKGLSWEVAARFNCESQDFVFIDADHSYASVCKDLRAWWPKVKAGATFAGHDFTGHHPDVMRAVVEFATEVKVFVQQRGSCWVMRKPGHPELRL